MSRTLASRILMVEPRSFRMNEETAPTNSFQQEGFEGSDMLLRAAREEFEVLRATIASVGIEVVVHGEPEGVDAPDSLFPNNWFAVLPGGQAFLFSVLAENRRRELHPEWILPFSRGGELIDLRAFEAAGVFLEGTGSLVLDHRKREGYACLSSRTHPAAIAEFTARSGYPVFTFRSVDQEGRPYYHTNVMMALGEQVAIVALESLPDHAERLELRRRLEASGRKVVPISQAQVARFAGNLILLQNGAGERFWICSTGALASLGEEQLDHLATEGRILAVPLPTIERVGGGGARCMIGELF